MTVLMSYHSTDGTDVIIDNIYDNIIVSINNNTVVIVDSIKLCYLSTDSSYVINDSIHVLSQH